MSESKEQQWRVIPMDIHGWAIHDAAGNVVVKDIYDEEIARFIVRVVNSNEALMSALRAALPTCDEVVDRDTGTPCGAIAVWVGSFARHYCDEHHKSDQHPMKVALAGREALALAGKES